MAMASFDQRSTLEALGRMIALAVIAAHTTASAQPNSSAHPEGSVQVLADAIDEIRSLRGSNSPELLEPLRALSLLYEENRNHELALALIVEMTQVIEVNYGLHTLDEAQLMRQSIRIKRARGDEEAAWEEEQDLLRLIRRRRHQADARTVPMLLEIADHRRAILARYRAGGFPPEIVLGCYYSEWAYDANGTPQRTGCRSGNRNTVIRALHAEAERLDSEAAAVSGRLQRWLELPCAKPEAPTGANKPRSRELTKEEMQTYFRALSDYAGCTQAKYDHAASTNPSPEDLSRLAANRKAAADELAAQAALYNQRFGR